MALALFFWLAWGLGAASGAEPKKKPPAGEVPLHITAARLEADQQQRTVTFTGQVKAVYGDAILYADQLQVFYQPAPAAAPPPSTAPESADTSPLGELGGGKIDRIVAKGSVRFVQEDKVATGQEAVYYKNREEVVLLGNPQLWQKENNVKGEKISFFLENKRVLVESSSRQRVEAHLYPSGQAAVGSKGILPVSPGRKGRGPQPKGGDT
ncbi:MAG: LptA/OstA family protein [Thermodesulfobacteriota bacterium]